MTRRRHHLKVHTFRALTAVLAWALVLVAYFLKPELLTSTQRVVQQGIEAISDSVPQPWKGGWAAFRELGGVTWLQITLLILAVRVALWTIAATWRLIFQKTGSSRYERMSDPVALGVYGALTLALFGFLFLLAASVD